MAPVLYLRAPTPRPQNKKKMKVEGGVVWPFWGGYRQVCASKSSQQQRPRASRAPRQVYPGQSVYSNRIILHVPPKIFPSSLSVPYGIPPLPPSRPLPSHKLCPLLTITLRIRMSLNKSLHCGYKLKQRT